MTPIVVFLSSFYCPLEQIQWLVCGIVTVCLCYSPYTVPIGLLKFAEDRGFSGEKFNAISLGQGQVNISIYSDIEGHSFDIVGSCSITADRCCYQRWHMGSVAELSSCRLMDACHGEGL